MTDKADNQTDRVERLLQQWGVEEARRGANPPAMLRLDGERAVKASVSRRVLRWAPLAAAAMLLAAAGGVLYMDSPAWRTKNAVEQRIGGAPAVKAVTPPSAVTQPDAHRIRTLEKESADLRHQLAAANAKVAERVGLESEIAGLRGRLERMGQEQEAKTSELTTALAGERKARQEQAKLLDAARLRVTDLETAERVLKTASAEAAAAKKESADLKLRLAAAGEELTRRQKAEESAQEKLAAALQDAQRLELRHRETIEAFQRTYLAAVAPGQSGLQARKTAVRTRQMIQRLAGLSGEVKSDQSRQLLNSVEAVLTRLELVDVDQPDIRESFYRLVSKGNLEGRIDEALAAPAQAESVTNWLFEAKLILMGDPNAG